MSNQPNNPSVGATGFEIFIETKLDLTGAASIAIAYRKPDGATGSWTATAHSKDTARSNTRYGARYITANANDLDQADEWELQVVVTGLDGFTGPGAIAKMTVEEAL